MNILLNKCVKQIKQIFEMLNATFFEILDVNALRAYVSKSFQEIFYRELKILSNFCDNFFNSS